MSAFSFQPVARKYKGQVFLDRAIGQKLKILKHNADPPTQKGYIGALDFVQLIARYLG